ncbi:hypothetical protein PF050_05470 [Kosakonia pseudosacchari]|uniref:hypothetical protein n=1 Tax=Kosakonia pseudosacchari TaxID=1646340 RepID=UPI0022F140B7|nr:hypothetical protein [Kosakonia pseudosacchari]WBU50373.1 hypothetical protein PF050_05470 [Kosakonia pseudosacchari]
MSIQDVGSAAALQTLPEIRQSKTITFAGKEIVTESSISVNISAEALAKGMEGRTAPTKEEAEKRAQAMAVVRNANTATYARGPSLASEFYSDPQSAGDAVKFIDFFQHSTVNPDDMAAALHQALVSPQASGDSTTSAMDLSMTQAKLNEVVSKYISADYQQQAREFVAGFIAEKAEQADQTHRVVLTQASNLAQSLGNTTQARQHQQAMDQLSAGTHASQTVRHQMLSITTSNSDSESWFRQFNQSVDSSGTLPFIRDIEKNHISALQQQWQQFAVFLQTAKQSNAAQETGNL